MVVVARVAVEPGDVRVVRVDLGRPVGHPLRDHAPHTGTLFDPDRGRRPEVADLGGFAEQREAVGGQRQQPVDRVLHLRGGENVGHQLERLFELLVEVVGGERQLRRRQA